MLISTAELQKEGVTQARIFSDQDTALGERLVRFCKTSNWGDFVNILRAFFDGDREFPLDDRLQEFASYMAVAAHVDKFGCGLKERMEITTEALDGIRGHFVDTSSCVGNALNTWPKGKRLVQDLQAYTRQLAFTDELVGQFAASAAQLSHTLGSIGCLLTCDSQLLANLGKILEELGNIFSKDINLIVAEFAPAKSDKAMASPLDMLVVKLLPAAWQNMLEGLLTESCDSKHLIAWSHALTPKWERMVIIQTIVMNQVSSLLAPGQFSALSKDAESYKCCLWFLDLAKEMQNSFKNGETCQSLWSQRISCLKTVSELGNEQWSPAPFAKSPLVSVDGPCFCDLCYASRKVLSGCASHL